MRKKCKMRSGVTFYQKPCKMTLVIYHQLFQKQKPAKREKYTLVFWLLYFLLMLEKCCKLYKYHTCLKNVNGRQVAKTCSGYQYCRGKKKICGAALLTKVTLKDGKSNFYPIKYYCYNSIINSLEKLVQRKGIPEKCELWRERKINNGDMADVYDGQLWKDFQTVDRKDFLKAPRNYGFMLNFDFFQPMKHRKDYSPFPNRVGDWV
jgi:hypothetical protein